MLVRTPAAKMTKTAESDPAWSCRCSVSERAKPHALIVSRKPTSQDLVHQPRELLLGEHARILVAHLAAAEEHQRRDRQHPEAGRGVRRVVDVDLDDLQTAAVIG